MVVPARFKTVSFLAIGLVSFIIIFNFVFFSSSSSYGSRIINLETRLNKLESFQIKSFYSNKDSISQNKTSIETIHSFISKYPMLLDCKNEYNKHVVGQINNQKTDEYNYATPASKQVQELRIVRAIIIYFPIDKSSDFELEFRWLYRTWINIQSMEPVRWRTDLVLFIDQAHSLFSDNNFFLHKLNCSFNNRRTNSQQGPMCTLLNFKALKDRKDAYLDQKSPVDFYEVKKHYAKLFNNVDIFKEGDIEEFKTFLSTVKNNLASYGYLDSILMAFEGYEYFKSAGYDFLIRSDMDVFLAPLLARWVPRYCNDFYVGQGGFGHPFNFKRLNRIAENLNLLHADQTNLGSTWISTPHQFRLVSYLTLTGMAYLATEEFAEPEKDGRLGVEMWPDWYYGVVLLYGQHIALNHVMATNELRVVKIQDLLDFPSTNEQSISTKLHIHVFHSDDLFSKFSFKKGKYEAMAIPSDKDTDKVRYYALKMALEGKRTPCEKLYEQMVQAIASKDAV